MQKWGVVGTTTKVCAFCNKSFVVNRERGSIRRKYCSQKCARLVRNLKPVETKCVVCKKMFIPTDSAGNFTSQIICCSKECKNLWKYKTEVLRMIKSGKKRKSYPMSDLSRKKMKDHLSDNRKNLTDGYIIDLLLYKTAPGQAKEFGRKIKVYKSRCDVPLAAIELKRQQITLKREIIKGRGLLNGTT
jgi:hypothetical protein